MTISLATTFGTLPVLRAEVREPLEGAWVADLRVDTDDAVTGAATLSVDGVEFVGTIRRGANEHGQLIAQMVGGAGGLGHVLTAQAYANPSLSTVLASIMAATGETLSPDTDVAVTAAQVARWSRPRGPAGLSLKQVCDESPAEHWRVLRDGTVWLGAETWPAVPPAFAHTEISRDPSQGTITVAPDDGSGLIQPGETFTDAAGAAHRIASVTTISDAGKLRQVLHEQDADGSSVADRMIGPFRRLVESMVGRRIDYSQVYPSRVDIQNADGTLDLTPDDPRIAGDGYQRIPIVHGLPGITVVVPAGVRVSLHFENGNPNAPRAALWPDGSSVTTITVAGDLHVTGEVWAQYSGPGTGVKVSTHLTPSPMGPLGPPTPGS